MDLPIFADDLPPYAPPEHDLRDFFYPHTAELYPPVRDPFLVEGLIPRVGVVLLAAPPKTGKTDLATALALAVATGAPFAGRNVEKGPVLLANYEENARERRDVLSRLNAEVPDLWHGDSLPGVDTETGLELLGRFCAEVNPVLVVVDSLHAAVDRADLGRARAARRAIAGLGELAARHRAVVLALHHTVLGGDRPAEHLQLQAAAGATVVLRATPHPTLPETRVLNLAYCGRALGLRRTARLVSEASLTYRAATEDDLDIPELSLLDPTAERIRAALAELPATAEDLASRLAIPEGTVKNALRRLRDSGHVGVASTTDRTHTYARTSNS